MRKWHIHKWYFIRRDSQFSEYGGKYFVWQCGKCLKYKFKDCGH